MSDKPEVQIIVQPYTRHGNQGRAIRAWDAAHPEHTITRIGAGQTTIDRAVGELILRAAERLMDVQVETRGVKSVPRLPTDEGYSGT